MYILQFIINLVIGISVKQFVILFTFSSYSDINYNCIIMLLQKLTKELQFETFLPRPSKASFSFFSISFSVKKI